jgi:hypothetical protein
MMLTEDEVKALLVCRMEECFDSANSGHAKHVVGQVRALVAVLTGEPPPRSTDACVLLAAAGIPYVETEDGGFRYDREWLVAHEFVIDGEDFDHPRFGKKW